MQTSVQQLKNFLTEKEDATIHPITIWIITFLCLIAYFLPWIHHQTTSLTLGAYDLAEWAGLHPLIRISDPPRLVSLYLRAIPVLLVALISFNVPRPIFKSLGWWLSAGFIIATVLALLPPLEYFTNVNARQDPNFQQHFQLALASLSIGLIGLSGLLRRFRWFLNIIIAIMGIGIILTALTDIIDAMEWTGLSVNVGIGAIFMFILFVLLATYSIIRILRRTSLAYKIK